jgi:hypothetical protein
MSTDVDDGDAGDAHGHIDTDCPSAGGRKVAGSNPVAPTDQDPLRNGFFGTLIVPLLPRGGLVVPAVLPNGGNADLGAKTSLVQIDTVAPPSPTRPWGTGEVSTTDDARDARAVGHTSAAEHLGGMIAVPVTIHVGGGCNPTGSSRRAWSGDHR